MVYFFLSYWLFSTNRKDIRIFYFLFRGFTVILGTTMFTLIPVELAQSVNDLLYNVLITDGSIIFVFLIFIFFISTSSNNLLEMKPSVYLVSSYSYSKVKDPFFNITLWQVKGSSAEKRPPSIPKGPSSNEVEGTEAVPERSIWGRGYDSVSEKMFPKGGSIEYDPSAKSPWPKACDELSKESSRKISSGVSDSSKSVVGIKDIKIPEELTVTGALDYNRGVSDGIGQANKNRFTRNNMDLVSNSESDCDTQVNADAEVRPKTWYDYFIGSDED
jgi:hypothetical protein